MEKLNSIYAKTYNFVYLRAKTILKKEEDVQQLMKEVYWKAVAEDVREDKLYEWLGRQVYILGCNKFRKKKVREAEVIELDRQMYEAQKGIDRETTKEVICDALEDLPDMYQATLYAFYYDHMKMKDIANVMGYSTQSMINRINYVNKYLEKVLENYQEETKTKVQFSVEIVCEALRDWSAKNRLSDLVAQNIYAAICRELGTTAENVCEEGGLAGADCRVVKTEEEVSAVCQELEAYSVKKGMNGKKTVLFAGLALLVLLTFGGIFILGKTLKKDKDNEKKHPVSQQEETDDEANVEEDIQADVEDDEEPQDEMSSEDSEASDDDYILPKSDKEKLTRADLEGLTKEELRLARNEIYARHGMIFGASDLDNYFATKSWYKPTVPFADFDNKVEMSIVEEQNIILIQQVEKEK